MSRRAEQTGSVIHRALQQLLSEGLADPRVQGAMLTVLEVRVTDDRRQAIVRISVLPEKKQDVVAHALRDAARYLRREVGERVAIHNLPEFIFKLDSSLKQQARVLEALAKARAEHDAPPAGGLPSSEHPPTPTAPTEPPP
ncbi:MAG: 30S ribosome-binding factor RbfA [Phycisphaerales bacterium]|nr:30S ribosome-binding factor RbfA [Phycisphaerales bacterium]